MKNTLKLSIKEQPRMFHQRKNFIIITLVHRWENVLEREIQTSYDKALKLIES